MNDSALIIKGIVARQGDASYDVSRCAFNVSRHAKLVVSPVDAEDVSKAILFAKANKLELALAGGFHSTSGASSTEGGLVIDFATHMNAVRIDAEERLAYVQGGAIFADVEREAIKHGLAACAGTVNDIGVAGLSLAGGFGWLTGEHGLVIDNIVSATVVVANGDILNASAIENTDLFWAIRGGGSNFGAVVELVFKLHSQRSEVYTTALTYSANLLPILVQQINKWTRKQAANEGAHLTFAIGADGQPIAKFFGFKNANAEAGKAAFQGFVELGPTTNQSGMVAYEELGGLQNGPRAPFRMHCSTHVPRLDLKVFKRSLEAFTKLITEHPEVSSSTIVFEFYNHEKLCSVPVDATAFAARASVYNVLVATAWNDASFTPISRRETQLLASTIAEAASTSASTNIGYSNYADGAASSNKTDEQARLAFGSNYTRLQKIKQRYDPEVVFNKWFAIRPSA